MITRFRVEGESENKEQLEDDLLRASTRIINEMNEINGWQGGDWECTQDVLSGSPGDYRGRMVLIYHRNGDEG